MMEQSGRQRRGTEWTEIVIEHTEFFFLFFNLLAVIFRTTSNEDYNDGARDAYKRGPREGKETIEARLRLHDE